MADNLSKTEWDAGAEVSSDDIAGIHYPRVKAVWGVDGVATDAAAATPLPTAPPINAATQIDTTTTPLTASATYTSATFDSTVVGKFVTHYIFADVDGNHVYQESHDGSTWRTIDNDPITPNVPFVEEHIVNARYHRAQFVNGGTGQTTFNHQLVCSFVGVAHNVGLRAGDNIVQGDKTHNVSAPSTAEALEVIGAIAKAAAPTYTEGTAVMPRVTLSGDQAITLDGEAVVLGAGTAGIGKLTANSGVDIGDVDVLSMPAVTQPTASNLNAQVVGELAHDAVDSGNPQKIGGVARNSNATSVANLDRVNATFDLGGRQVIKLGNPRGLFIQNTITLTTTTETTLLAAAASTFHDMTCLMATNTSATAVRIDFRDATAGTVRFSLAIAANGGAVINFPYPIEQTAVNNNWTAQLSGAVTDIRIFAQAVKNVA